MRHRPAGLGLALLVALTLPAQASETRDCAAYAAAAVAHHARNVSLSCGYRGPGWQPDAAVHAAWCGRPGTTQADLDRESGARADALAICEAKGAACLLYADLSRRQGAANRASACGQTGARWAEDPAAHARWCMTAAPDAIHAELQTRADLLDSCTARLTATELQSFAEAHQRTLNLLAEIARRSAAARRSTLRRLGD